MKKIFKYLFICAILWISSPYVKAQTDENKNKNLAAAIEFYSSLRYVDAIEELKLVLAKEPDNIDAMEMIANSYRLTKQYKESLEWYTKLCSKSYFKPDWALRYAEALANNKQYEKSEQWYRKYLSIVPSDRRALLFSQADFDKLGKGVNWNINYLNINTQASEYGPMLYRDGLIFSSNRSDNKPVKYVFGWNNTPFCDLYYLKDRKKLKPVEDSKTDTAKTDKSVKKKDFKYNDDNTPVTSNDSRTIGATFDPSIFMTVGNDTSNSIVKLNKKINTKYHEGVSALAPDGDLMFTRNNYYRRRAEHSANGINKLKLFTAEGYGWRKIKPFLYNNNEYSVGHPTISKDGKILVFASDMPGGMGGVDLYYCIRLTDKSPWSRPVNFGGKVNTEGDEEFPYIDNFDRLYFSSNGWPGFGGFDIFSIKLQDLKPIGPAINLGPPLNSPFDDFSIAKTSDSTGYFSSNRRGNDDIYSFKRKDYKIYLKGRVIDAVTGKTINNANVVLKRGESERTLKLDEKGIFLTDLATNEGYELDANLDGFISDRKYIGTDGITKDTTIYADLYLKKTNKIQDYVIQNCDSLKQAFYVGNIYYDLDKSDIRVDAYDNLDKLTDLLRSHPDIQVITRSYCDSRASEEYNRLLSLRRGDSAKEFLINRGINPNRIKVEYFGENGLVNQCSDGVLCSEAQQQLNRRTEFEIIYHGINLATLKCDK